MTIENTRTTTIAMLNRAAIALLLFTLSPGSAAAQEPAKRAEPSTAEEIQLDYKSLSRGATTGAQEPGKAARTPARAERSRTSGPPAKSLPPKVLIEPPSEAPVPDFRDEPEGDEPDKRAIARGAERPRVSDRRGEDPRATDRRGRIDDRRLPYGHLDRMASQAGRRAADEQMATAGRREYFRLGFYEGLHAAFDDDRFARWYYRDGREAGERDPRAHAEGRSLGRDRAEDLARERAETQVVDQFTDLRHEPRPYPNDRPPLASYSLPRVAEPALHQVFYDRPWHGHAYDDLGRGDWLDPWSLYRHAGYEQVYRDDWADAGAALRDWRHAHRERWLAWGDYERRRFEQIFHYAFRHRLAQLSSQADHYYRDGLEAGWYHGLDLVADWQFRRGYGEGYEHALHRAAEHGFDSSYRTIYRRHYDAVFDDWARNAKPALLDATLYDGDSDGVFEPGEALWVRFALVNYGGGTAQVEIEASGRGLAGAERRSLWLPRRTRLDGQEIELRVDARAPVRSEGEVRLVSRGRFDAPTHQLPVLSFRIAHALELLPRIELERLDAMAGRATVAVTMLNNSRRPASGRLVLFAAGRTLGGARLETLGPGERETRNFELEGIHPLDLLAGTVPLRAELHARIPGRDSLLDAFEGTLPEQISRRHDSGLVDYFIAVGRGEHRASRGEIARAQELMLERLRHDWHRAVAASGNPYRDDLRGGRQTALGELVRAVERNRRSLRDRRIFETLVPQIEALAESMPGTHPWLRRSMKKLARKLDS